MGVGACGWVGCGWESRCRGGGASGPRAKPHAGCTAANPVQQVASILLCTAHLDIRQRLEPRKYRRSTRAGRWRCLLVSSAPACEYCADPPGDAAEKVVLAAAHAHRQVKRLGRGGPSGLHGGEVGTGAVWPGSATGRWPCRCAGSRGANLTRGPKLDTPHPPLLHTNKHACNPCKHGGTARGMDGVASEAGRAALPTWRMNSTESISSNTSSSGGFCT